MLVLNVHGAVACAECAWSSCMHVVKCAWSSVACAEMCMEQLHVHVIRMRV